MFNVYVHRMKRILVFLFACLSIPLANSCSSSTDYPVNTTNTDNTWTNTKPVGTNIGEQAPEISMNDINGSSFKLSAKRGNIMLLDFWASWCPPCKTSSVTLKNLKSTFSGKAFDIVSVSFDYSKEDCKQYVSDNNMSWNHVYGGYDMSSGFGPLSQTYKITGIPQFVLLDKYGTIIYKGSNDRDLQSEIEKALK